MVQAKATPSIDNSLANPFDLRQQRDTAAVTFTYAATRAVDLDVRFSSSSRDGQQPWGASFAFNNAGELPKPLDDRTNDLSVGATWANPRGMFRLGWDGSWFNNNFTSLTWDNPAPTAEDRISKGRPVEPPDWQFSPSSWLTRAISSTSGGRRAERQPPPSSSPRPPR